MRQKDTLRPAFLLVVLGLFFSGFVFSDDSYFAPPNPTLRSYFLQQQLRQGMSFTDIYGRTYYRGNARFLEQHVDRMVDDFLQRVSQKLYALKTRLNEVQQAREEVLRVAPDNESRRNTQKHWKDALKSLANEAKGLRKMLSFVFLDLDAKIDFKPQIQNDLGNLGFQKEISFIEEQIAKAAQRINDYFFLPTHTVEAKNLKGENMMIYLYRVEKIAQKLSKTLPAG